MPSAKVLGMIAVCVVALLMLGTLILVYLRFKRETSQTSPKDSAPEKIQELTQQMQMLESRLGQLRDLLEEASKKTSQFDDSSQQKDDQAPPQREDQ